LPKRWASNTSSSYDRNLDDLIDIQENVAIEIANALQTAMNPEALARMVSSGTNSVPAFEAYLRGLAVGESTFATGDIYENLNARDAYERAIELDPEFAQAYWRLAIFWRNQLTVNYTTSGITDLTPAEMLPIYYDGINKAIEYEKDPVSKILYRAAKARTEMKYRQALRLNTEYLEQRPNDQAAQFLHLTLLAELDMRDEVTEAVAEFYARDGYNPVVTGTSLTRLLYTGEPETLRTFAKNAVERFGDNANVMYQVHRALLWVGDIDGASKVLPVILASDMPDDSRYLVLLRQACAENRLADATRLHMKGTEQFAGNASIIWLAHLIMGNDEEASESLMEYDSTEDMMTLTSFLTYGTFDPRPYPNLMAILESQGIEWGEPVETPYQCRR
jgi:tetratricopeptide (TPR) repeat protein